MSKIIKDENGKVYKEKKPFYKKWWVILLAVLFVIGLATGGDDKEKADTTANNSDAVDQVKKEDPQKEAPKKEAPKKEDKMFSIGEEVSVGDMVYVVNNVEVSNQVGPSVLPTTASGTFLIANVTVLNKGNKAVTVDSSFFKLVDGEKEFEADSIASMSANQGEMGQIDNSFFLQKLNPDVSLSGNVVFDISEDQAVSSGNALRVQTGAFGTQKAVIKL